MTNRIRLGTLVTAVGFRYPSLLAKIAATLDVISQGRLEFGIGAGWYEPEYRAFAYPFPNTQTRVEQLAEATQILKKMWTEEKATFQGKHFTINEAICNPKPLQKPHPPIWIGGTSRRVLQVAAKFADGWNSVGLDPLQYREKLQNLEKECMQAGREPNEIRRSIYTGIIIGKDERQLQEATSRLEEKYRKLDETKDQYVRRIRADNRRMVGTPSEIREKTTFYNKLGVEEIICFFPDLPNLAMMRSYAEEIILEL